jgi:hypothetical protein
LFFTMTAFLPAYLPVRRMTTLLGCTQQAQQHMRKAIQATVWYRSVLQCSLSP